MADSDDAADARVDPSWLRGRLEPTAQPLAIALSDAALDDLARFATRLLAWAPRVNLTGARDAATLADEHIADALPLIPLLPQGAVVVDVGSGAGLPGLPLALLRRDLVVYLLEPRERRHAFLRACLRDAELPTDRAVRTRLEDWEPARDPSSGLRIDVALSRAVWPPAEWLERGQALVRPGGRVIALEGLEPLVELPAGARRVVSEVPGRPRALLVLDTPSP